jgi:hypothetical protein
MVPMKWLGLALLGVAAAAAACGGGRMPEHASGTSGGSGGTSGGSGGATTTSQTTGGSGGSIVLAGGAGGSVSGGGIPGTQISPTCNDPTIFFDINGDGPLQHFDASCTPRGHLVIGSLGPPPPPPPSPAAGILVLEACPGGLVSLRLQTTTSGGTWPGTATIADGSYSRGGVDYQLVAGTATVTVTSYQGMGGVIEGTFTAPFAPTSAADGGASLVLSGSFRVCHWYDEIIV